MTKLCEHRPPPDVANFPLTPLLCSRGGPDGRPGSSRSVPGQPRCDAAGATRDGGLGLGLDRSHLEQLAGDGCAVGWARHGDRRRCLPTAERRELRVQRVGGTDDPCRDQRLGLPARLGRRDRRRIQRPAGSFCRRRRAHPRHPPQSRSSARPLGEPARGAARVRREERRPPGSGAAPPGAERPRLEQLFRGTPGVVPDRLHPPGPRRRGCDRDLDPPGDHRRALAPTCSA